MKRIIAVLVLLCLTLTSCSKHNPDVPTAETIEEAVTTENEVSTEPIITSTEKQLEKAPRLGLTLVQDGETEQQLQAIQLTTSWFYTDENGNGSGYEADSPHPLQLSDYDDCTFQFNGVNGEILLSFSDNYPPQSVSVQRWNTIYYMGEQNVVEYLDKNESVKVTENTIFISNDSNDYIYEVCAKWEQQGTSRYSFRINSPTPNITGE